MNVEVELTKIKIVLLSLVDRPPTSEALEILDGFKNEVVEIASGN